MRVVVVVVVEAGAGPHREGPSLKCRPWMWVVCVDRKERVVDVLGVKSGLGQIGSVCSTNSVQVTNEKVNNGVITCRAVGDGMVLLLLYHHSSCFAFSSEAATMVT